MHRSVKDIHKLTKKIAAFNRFMSRAMDKWLPFFKILNGVKNFAWTEEGEG